ncbi:hypothetical protein SAMN02910447_01315 [Ruminococcus sp. YE71]|uniref:hypothetical protein n=1 Tax=unclassified Ruminococcus TaxID=2608920 RepID=UPI00088738B5|nr:MULTISPECIES: hypothetical protein [unclassified Ruminococcus]SDA17425.1 hypothetical protein SAMN02910446_01314 [Ruminococcus sp. YE78]SFW26788.1 hypothetical protein SAMN02910447_01315 [Ruminococcus sp. YE71]
MRDYGSFLNNMAPEQPKPEPQPELESYEEAAAEQAAQEEYYDEGPQSDIPMESISLDQGYSDFGSAQPMGMNSGEQSNIPMESASPPPAAPKRYSAEDYERATNYDYATRGVNNDYQTIRNRRKTFASNSGENMGLGIVGAIIGAAIGTAIWYGIGLTGYISSWGALAIVVSCFFGYKLLAGGFGSGGALVVGIAIIVSVFVGIRLLYGHMIIETQEDFKNDKELLQQYDMEPEDVYVPTIIEASFTHFNDIIDTFPNPDQIRRVYDKDMGTSYLFTGVAAIIFFVRRTRH